MTLKNLIESNIWLSVSLIFQELYPNESQNISGYKDVFEKLLVMDANESDISIEVVQQKDDFDGEEYVDVSGRYKYPKNEEEKFSQAIEFIPWNQWLGMEVCAKSLNRFSELEIISHCLYEMTFMGFEEATIQEELSSIKQHIENYKELTDEEKAENTTTLEDLINDIENENNEADS